LGAGLAGRRGTTGLEPPCPWVAFHTERGEFLSVSESAAGLSFPDSTPLKSDPIFRARSVARPWSGWGDPAGLEWEWLERSAGFMELIIHLGDPVDC